MPVDASIYNLVRPQPSPLSQISDIYQVQAQQRQAQAQQMQLQQQQQQVAAQKALDQAMQTAINPDGTFNKDALRSSIVQSGNGHLWPQLDEQLTKADKARADLEETQSKVNAARLDLGGSIAAGIRALGDAPNAFVTGLAYAKHAGIIDDGQAQQMMQAASQPGGITRMVDA